MGFLSSLKSIGSAVSSFGSGLSGITGGLNAGLDLFNTVRGIGGGSDVNFNLTDPRSGSELGKDALDYYNKAFPGTNPWERLGTQNPMGPVSIASRAQNTAQRNVDKQTETARRNANLNAQVQRENISLQNDRLRLDNRRAALEGVKEFGQSASGSIEEFIRTGKVQALERVESGAGYQDVQSRKALREEQADAIIAKIGAEFGDPAAAATASRAYRMFKIGKRDRAAEARFKRNFEHFAAQGRFPLWMRNVFQAANQYFPELADFLKELGAVPLPSSVPGRPGG